MYAIRSYYEMSLSTGGAPIVIKPGENSETPSQGSSTVTPMQAQSTTAVTSSTSPVQIAAPVVTTAPVSAMQAESTGAPTLVQTRNNFV